MTDGQIALALAGILVLTLVVAILGRRPRRIVVEEGAAGAAHLDRRLDAVEKRLDNQDHDLKNLRSAMQGLPTKNEVHRIELTLAEMRGEMRGLSGEVKGVGRQVERIDEFLMTATAKAIADGKTMEARDPPPKKDESPT